MCYEQLSFDFSFSNKLNIGDKKIRLIELFGGVGSQALSLERLEKNGYLPNGFEHYRLCEFDPYAIQSYNAIHHTNFEPSDITKIDGKWLGITDTHKYNYVVCYTFPCVDISNAGHQNGFAKGKGTRSGLLWEVERLLNECDELPQVLLMENVKAITSKKFMPFFQQWIDTLTNMGYKSQWKIMNASDYGVPQNRERCFMVSYIDKSKEYTFPKKKELQYLMQDYLEGIVEDKFYLNQDYVEELIKNGNVKIED